MRPVFFEGPDRDPVLINPAFVAGATRLNADSTMLWLASGTSFVVSGRLDEVADKLFPYTGEA